MKKQANNPEAAEAAVHHSARIAELVTRIAEAAKADAENLDANWGHVGSLAHAHELLVQAAFALGAIDENEARIVDSVSL